MDPEEEVNQEEQQSSRIKEEAKEKAKNVAKKAGKETAKVALKAVKAAIKGIIKVFLMLPLPIQIVILIGIAIGIAAFMAITLSESDQEGFENIIQHTEEKAGRVSSGTSSSGSTVAPGEKGYEFFQADYEDVQFGTSNIKSGGCGITSMAMCVSDLLGKPIDPRQLASEFNINPYWISGSGVSWAFFNACAEHYGLYCLELGTNPNVVVQALREGKKVISSQNNYLGSLFTGGGHIIYFYGLDSSEKILVKDPNRENIKKGLLSHSWDPAIICSWSANNWAIWK